jgi:hypothetical protein
VHLRVIDGVEVDFEGRTIAVVVGRGLRAAAKIFLAYELLLTAWFGWGRSRLCVGLLPWPSPHVWCSVLSDAASRRRLAIRCIAHGLRELFFVGLHDFTLR